MSKESEVASGTGDDRESRMASASAQLSLDTNDLRPPQPHLPSSQQRTQAPPQRRPVCRYFGTKSGCRSGSACSFRHEVPDTTTVQQPSTAAAQQQPARRSQQPTRPFDHSRLAPEGSTAGRQQSAANTSRITPRPVPEAQRADPRAYQVSQLRRRFTPLDERGENDASVLTFRMRPSDPDFPFDMDALHCSLRVPLDYPKSGKPSLRVTNPDMERGYQINIERGFDRIVDASPSSTLLAYFNALDKQLEGLLSAEKAETMTVKIVSHTPRPEGPESVPAPVPKARDIPQHQPRVAPTVTHKPAAPAPTAAQLSAARSTRETQVRQLEARMGRLPQFSKSRDGLTFTVPIEVRKRDQLPVELQAIKQIKLIVPQDYNISPCRIELVGVSGAAAEAVELAFRRRAASMPQMSLFNHVNYLSQNMHVLAKDQPQPEKSTALGPSIAQPSPAAQEEPQPEPKEVPLPIRNAGEPSDRPHVVVIPRPPEWDKDGGNNAGEDSDSSSESEDDDYSADEEGRVDIDQPVTSTSSANASTPERGVAVSFPHMELHGIELLEIGTLNITVKCERCKDTKEVTGLQNKNRSDAVAASSAQAARADSCKKCAATFAIGFRAEFVHANSVRAGYLDFDGCTIVDMLPSSFIPTCAECSTAYPKPGVVAVRGDASMAFCRSCHRKMTFRLPEIKFLRTGVSGVSATTGFARKKKSENLGIVAGRELPNRGRCSHYKKSYRWFRFSCCQKVYPCDRCHDETAEHTIEHANRMICGFCSREQNYRPKDCGVCHAWLTVRPGKGFWEGGQGTRDRVKMSRKDPRKYKRAGGSKGTAS